jgi:hypothetical protein
LARTYARYVSFGNVAEARLKDIGPYVNTPFVARDMLAITKAHGYNKLKYWGVSYGTALGMFIPFVLERTWLIPNRNDIRFYVP